MVAPSAAAAFRRSDSKARTSTERVGWSSERSIAERGSAKFVEQRFSEGEGHATHNKFGREGGEVGTDGALVYMGVLRTRGSAFYDKATRDPTTAREEDDLTKILRGNESRAPLELQEGGRRIDRNHVRGEFGECVWEFEVGPNLNHKTPARVHVGQFKACNVAVYMGLGFKDRCDSGNVVCGEVERHSTQRLAYRNIPINACL